MLVTQGNTPSWTLNVPTMRDKELRPLEPVSRLEQCSILVMFVSGGHTKARKFKRHLRWISQSSLSRRE